MDVKNTHYVTKTEISVFGRQALDAERRRSPSLAGISVNIARTTGIICNLNQVLPCSVLLTIYNSLILPHLNYGILAWGYDTTRMFRLQKNSLIAISFAKYIAHTDPLFKSVALLKVHMYT